MAKKSRNGFYHNRLAFYDIKSFRKLHPNKVKQKRWLVFARDNYSCIGCGAKPIGVVSWEEMKPSGGIHYDVVVNQNGQELMLTIDHRIPKSKGGSNDISNLDSLCSNCNHAKKDTMPEGLAS